MEDIKQLITRYGLQEDSEHIIIPLPDKEGKKRRCFLLKRHFLRIVYSEGHYVDYPLADAIEATVKYPDLLLSQSLLLIYNERGIDDGQPSIPSNRTNGIE